MSKLGGAWRWMRDFYASWLIVADWLVEPVREKPRNDPAPFVEPSEVGTWPQGRPHVQDPPGAQGEPSAQGEPGTQSRQGESFTAFLRGLSLDHFPRAEQFEQGFSRSPNKVRPSGRRIWMSHCFSGLRAHLESAKRWRRMLQQLLPDDLIVAPWIEAAEVVPETPDNRAHFLELCARTAATCDLSITCGPLLSEGVRGESDAVRAAGKPVLDLTWWKLDAKTTDTDSAT